MKREKTLRQFLAVEQALTHDATIQAQQLPRPQRLCGRTVPEDLNDITFEQLCRLQSISGAQSLMTVPALVILGLPEFKVLNAPASTVVGFALWVSREVHRINECFAAASSKPTQEQVRAGINALNFGAFGICDWYAKRMGITDHEEVMSLRWIRICECMRMDSRKSDFEDKLRKIYQEQAKSK